MRKAICTIAMLWIGAMQAHADESARAAFSLRDGKVLFWQTNRLAGGQGICAVKFGFDGAALAQPIEDLRLHIRVVDRKGTNLGAADLALASALGGSGAARYREASFEGVPKWPLQDEGWPSPLCDAETTLIVESAAGRQSGKAVELVRFGQLRLAPFPKIKVRVAK